MSIDVEYAIKKDIRNNPVVREIDRQQKRDLRRAVSFAVLIVAMLLFSAWQHFKIVRNGYELEALEQARVNEAAQNRKLRLEVETLRAPEAVETRALRDLHMVAPLPANTLVIERTRASTPTKAIRAEIR
jgi:cell division protein FtsL